MGERYWDNQTSRNYSYVDGLTGQVIGTLKQRISDRLFEAYAYRKEVGAYLYASDARKAVEAKCVEIEAAQAAQRDQADGVSE